MGGVRRKGLDSGLGLSVVHRILDQHGGRISTVNRRDRGVRGVRVEILLPLSEAKMEKSQHVRLFSILFLSTD